MKLIIDINDSMVCNDIQNKVLEPQTETDKVIIDALYNGIPYEERPQGEREFIEILAQYVPEEICTYPEYRGKPYYSIHFRENGEDFVGFGTYNPEVLSEYLREYFIGADTRGEE